VVTFTNRAGRITACLLHYTCHPVNVFARTPHLLSSDWPGAWSAGVEALIGPAGVPLVVNGCCGNVNPWPPFVADFQPDHRRMGRELTRTTRAVLKAMEGAAVEGISAAGRVLKIPLKAATPKARRTAEAMLRKYPQPRWQAANPRQVEWEWMDAALLMSVELDRAKSPDYRYEIQVFRIGPIALIGLPGEPFVEGQLSIKEQSPLALNLVAHCANGYAGYLAPRAAYDRGGHEIRHQPAQWARLAPGSLERVVAATVGLLRKSP